MKRSEALCFIAKEFEKAFGGTEWQKEAYTKISLREAHTALDAVEKLGMLPPEHLFTSGERADHYLNEWEHEND